MPRITKPLTNTEVEKAKYKDKVFKLFDGQGLILKVAQTSKTWQFEYTRPYTKKRNVLSIGGYPSVTLAQARAKRDEYRALLAQNIDPMQYRDDAVKQATIDVSSTFEKLSDEWLSKQNYAKSSYSNAIMHLRYAKQSFGKKAVKDITVHDVIGCCRQFESQGKLTTSQAVKVKTSQVLDYAIGLGLLDRNVVNDIGMKVLKSPIHDNRPAIIDKKEFIEMMGKVWNSDNLFYETKRAIWLLAMLFTRPGEILEMKTADIDFDEQVWRYTPKKTANSTKVDVIVPLPHQAASIIKEVIAKNNPSIYVFETTKRKSATPMDRSAMSKFFPLIGYKGKHCPHGFRASAKTILEEEFEYDPRYVEMQLGHVVKDSNGTAYNRAKFIKQRAEMLQKWADWLDDARISQENLQETM